MLGLLLLLAEAASGAPAPVPCEIVADRDEAGPLLIGQCGKNGVMLGSVTSYESAANAATGAVVAIVRRGEARQVLLVRAAADGGALLEDITPDVARQGRRAPRAGLGDLTVSLKEFATDAVIEIAASARDGETSSTRLSVQALIDDANARPVLPVQQPRVIEVGAQGQGPVGQ